MPGIDEALENLEQHCDIVEVQTGRRFVEDEQISTGTVAIRFALDVFRIG